MGGTNAQLPVGCQMSLSGHSPSVTQFNYMAQVTHNKLLSPICGIADAALRALVTRGTCPDVTLPNREGNQSEQVVCASLRGSTT
jgi:hypothetical protein